MFHENIFSMFFNLTNIAKLCRAVRVQHVGVDPDRVYPGGGDSNVLF
jgi:hypothetical protein